MKTKQRKVLDCFFYYDEIEMLCYRLEKHNDNVDLFVIIESELDFLYNKKEKFLDIEIDLFDKYREKIVHLIVPEVTKSQMMFFLDKVEVTLGTKKLENKVLTKDDLICFCIYFLCDFLKTLDLLVWDLIFISDVDEIIDFNKLEIIVEILSFGPVYLSQKEFIWSNKFYNPILHVGPMVMEFSQIVTKPETIYLTYDSRKNIKFPKKTIFSGWHFSHFYDHEKTLKKMNLLYPELNFTRDKIISSMNNLQDLVINSFGFISKLIENDDETISDPIPLANQFLGTLIPKKILVKLNNQFSFPEDNYNQIIDLDFELFIQPNKILYGGKNFDDFKKVFLINEVTDILRNYRFLNQDIITIVYGSSENDYIRLDWKTLKNKFLYDLISKKNFI